MDNIKWHAISVSEVLKKVDGSFNGLLSIDATKRLNIYGKNQFEVSKRFNVIFRFLRQFHNTLIYVLVFSATITLFLSHFIDSSIIFAVIMVNAFLGLIQEGKAEKAIDKIQDMLAPDATVIRDGTFAKIPAALLVPGDIVLIKSGDKIPADLRLIETKNLQVQEAILTGESNAVEKNTDTVLRDDSLGDRSSMVYSGTIAIYGKGKGVVVATGKDTEIGRIGSLLTEVKPLTTPLLCSMDTFGRWLSLAIIILAMSTFLVGIFVWNQSFDLMFMASVGVAVAAIPEGLPPVLTIILAIGVTRMAKRNAIVRHLPAVETMGAVTVICTDKTGTLTHGEQIVQSIVTSSNFYFVEENGQVVSSLLDNKKVEIHEHTKLLRAINAVLLCNDAEFTKQDNGQFLIHGNPIDKALLSLGLKTRIDPNFLKKTYPQTDLIPYESEHKYMATLHHDHTGKGFIYIKGAPEKIIKMCSKQQHDYWTKHVNALAIKGYRVLALAYKEALATKRSLLLEDLEKGMTLIAVFALIDAPRIEAAEAVEKCYSSGIKVKMITGDHAATAATIAAQVGIDQKYGVLLGNDIDEMDDVQFSQSVENINIFARTSAQHKIKLIQVLQHSGEVVAMTGDGVNDAPALKQADIGISMGEKGAAIAKEASTIVLADDNFATIVHAIEEGRVIFDNLRKAISFILPTNMAEAIIIVAAILSGFVLPMTPVQILWVNTVTAVTLSIALGFEPAEGDVMKKPPRNTKTPLLSPIFVWRLLFFTMLLAMCVLSLFVFQHASGVDLRVNRTMTVNMLVLADIVYLVHCRRFYESAMNLKAFFGSRAVLISILTVLLFQLLFTYLPIMQQMFGTANISVYQWGYLFFMSAIVFILMEAEKMVVRYSKLRLCFK